MATWKYDDNVNIYRLGKKGLRVSIFAPPGIFEGIDTLLDTPSVLYVSAFAFTPQIPYLEGADNIGVEFTDKKIMANSLHEAAGVATALMETHISNLKELIKYYYHEVWVPLLNKKENFVYDIRDGEVRVQLTLKLPPEYQGVRFSTKYVTKNLEFNLIIEGDTSAITDDNVLDFVNKPLHLVIKRVVDGVLTASDNLLKLMI